MKIFDCFMYFDEDEILDLRINILNEKVDYFVIVESTYNHKGENRKLLFNINKFERFKKKIIYLVYDQIPHRVKEIRDNDSEKIKINKHIYNAVFRENAQRNYIINGIKDADKDDIIIISDIDEIPNINSCNFSKIKNEIIIFKQDMFHYKYNLCIPNFKWSGSKAVKKKKLISPQWLRNIKNRKYPIYRIDTFFSEKKYINIKMIENGGWHFTNIKTANEILHKYKSYLHHWEFDETNIGENEIQNLIDSKQAIYNLKTDKRNNKFKDGVKLEKYNIDKLPIYIQDNLKKYQKWID